MGTLVVVATVLIAVFRTAHGGPDTKIIDDFCQGILRQSPADTNQCFDKANSHTIKGTRNASVIYLCCLGYFLDVTHCYKHFLGEDFGQFMVTMTTDKHVINIGNFVMMCKNDTKTLCSSSSISSSSSSSNTKTLNTADFLYWCSNGKSAQACTSR